MINFVDAGGKVNDSTDAAKTANLNLIHSLVANPARIYFPPGTYHFSGTIRIRKNVYLQGSSYGIRGPKITAFQFPSNTQGIVFDHHNTDNLNGASGLGTAEGSTVDGIAFHGSSSFAGENHGVLIRCFMNLRNVMASGFGGHGIYILADGGQPFKGNASNCLLEGCGGHENAKSGLCIIGGDANINQIVGGDFTGNGDWGILDESFLGNTFTGIHFSQNGRPFFGHRGANDVSIVRHNNKNWIPRYLRRGDASLTTPGTDSFVWAEYTQPLDFTPAAWVSDPRMNIRPGGAFCTGNPSDTQWSVFTGCYAEGSEPGIQIGSRTVIIGGDIDDFGSSGCGVYANSWLGSGQPAHLESRNGELFTRTNFGANSLLVGLGRGRGSGGNGTKITAGLGPKTKNSLTQARLENDWERGDIIFHADPAPGAILGWRCNQGGGTWEEIPFPGYTAGKNISISGSTISVVNNPEFASHSGTTAVKRTGSAVHADCALYVENSRGNHSWGLAAEFRVAADNDRPSIAFSHHAGESWSIGMMEDDHFKIKRRHGFRYGGWGEDYMRIDPVSGHTTFKGQITAAGVNLGSDVRLKENVETIEAALDKVCRMRGVTFTLKDGSRRSSGVIAQELQEVAPELVQGEGDEMRSVAYGNLVGYLIEAIKELRAENDVLTTRLEALEAATLA